MKLFYLICPFLFGLICFSSSEAQQVELFSPTLMASHTGKSSLRGISVVDDNLVWVSGSKGTVGITLDGGKNWKWLQPKGYEKRDFRDVQAFDRFTALVMAVGEPAIVLRTTDGGDNWREVFFDDRAGMFLDAMYFRDEMNGMIIGDPIRQIPFVATTGDGGLSWRTITVQNGVGSPILLDSGEAFFAASGSNLQLMQKGTIRNGLMVTGGSRSRLIHTDGQFVFELPFIPGGSSRGANAISMRNSSQGIIVGGDFSSDTASSNNCLLINLSKKKKDAPIFMRPQIPPSGYRSSVQYLFGNTWITCGTSGIDVSDDNGINWRVIAKDSYHAIGFSSRGKYVFMAGSGGRVAKLLVR